MARNGNSNVVTGTIKRLVAGKGFGFIAEDGDTGVELFFHLSDLVRGQFNDLSEGTRVRFVAKTTPKGPRASEVEAI